MQALLKERSAIEADIQNLYLELKTHKVGTSERLIDSDGFPRADVDVHGVLTVRNKIVRRKTDHARVAKQLEDAMLAYHAALKARGPAQRRTKTDKAEVKRRVLERHSAILKADPGASKADALQAAIRQVQRELRTESSAARAHPEPSPEPAGDAKVPPPRRQSEPTTTPSTHTLATSKAAVAPRRDEPAMDYGALTPFLLVDRVWPDSPSAVAGLERGDRIVKFGSVNRSNIKSDSVPSLVSHSVGKPILVVVRRGGDVLRLTLTPMRWTGRGLLGCFLKPIRNE